MTYTELYTELLNSKMIEPVQYSTLLQPPYPTWFDENATCAYHSGAKGHSTENCTRLKEVVLEMIKEGRLTFDTGVQSKQNMGPAISTRDQSEQFGGFWDADNRI